MPIGAIQRSIAKYIDLTRNMPDFISQSKQTISKNKMLLDLLRSGENTGVMTGVLNTHAGILAGAEREMLDLSNKHMIASKLVSGYPALRDNMYNREIDLGMLDAPAIITIAMLSGSVLSLYDNVSFKITMQNKYLNALSTLKTSLTAGNISQEEYNAEVGKLAVFKADDYKVSVGNMLVIGGVIFTGFYCLTNFDKVKKYFKSAKKRLMA